MESKLEHLIEKIKTDGIAEAQKSAAEIAKVAKKEADGIIKKAKADAEQIITDAGKEADKLKANAESALKQASRDTVLVTKEKLLKLFDAAFKKELGSTLSPEFVKELIVKIVDSWGRDKNLEVLVSDKDLKQLQDLVFAQGRAGLKDTVTIKVDKGISKGFRVGLKDNDVYYDFTDESIAEFLGEFLNPGIREILDRA
ncbi:DivIVA domain-containing protein [bacterium]|nr:DivIVA domain-containing protein [bacterium]MBU1064487.1 DivIVA domain-containing protein [bacterium]MBU1634262.1 DivIVA domain-containing protein [bacterium]MBU1872157.1 DivIVA domain-containing protein [bacterium]